MTTEAISSVQTTPTGSDALQSANRSCTPGTDHLSEPCVRAYRDGDFEDLVGMFDATWGWELPADDGVRPLLAQLYVASALLASDTVLVVEDAGRVRAVMCLGYARRDPRWTVSGDGASLLAVVQTAQRQLQATGAGRRVLRFYERVDAANALLLEELARKSIGWQAEIKLLLTDPAARGKGFGGRLMQAALDAAARRGLTLAMLRTDTHCAWQYYGKTGWEMAARIPWQDGTDIVSFAFVKRIGR